LAPSTIGTHCGTLAVGEDIRRRMPSSPKRLDLREDPSFLKEEAKDDKKRRAGMILRASMENPQELPQL